MINRVLNSIKGTNNILGFIPNGTGNDFARSVKETLSDGLNKVDVIKINDKYCINIACFGVDAEIANDDTYVHNTNIPKKIRYIIGVPKHFLNYNPKKLYISYDDEEIEDKFTTVVVCNGRFYGSGIKVSPSSILNDSMMEVYLVDEMKKLDMVSTILSMKNGKHETRDGVRKITTDNVFISSNEPIDINIDGEKYRTISITDILAKKD
jgi:diacylglycerol kinase family enzyme